MFNINGGEKYNPIGKSIVNPKITIDSKIVENSKVLSQEEKDLSKRVLIPLKENIDDHLLDKEIAKYAQKCYDTKLGPGTNNIINISDLKEAMYIEDDAELVDYISSGMNYRPNLLIIKSKEKELILIRNEHLDKKDPSLSIYKPSEDQFVEFDIDELKNMKLQGNDKLVFINRKHSEPLKAFQKNFTETATAGPFYHEEQEGGLCGIHAANAFIGKPIIEPIDFSDFKASRIESELKVQLLAGAHLTDESLNALTELSSSDLGNDPGEIRDYLVNLSKNNKIDKKYEKLDVLTFNMHAKFNGVEDIESEINKTNEDLSKEQDENKSQKLIDKLDRLNEDKKSILTMTKSLEDIDRCIVGTVTGNPHFIAFRKNDENKWVMIDSLNKNQEIFNSPLDWFIAKAQFGDQHFCFIGLTE